MIDIDFAPAYEGKIDPDLILEAVKAALDGAELDLSVRIGTEEEIQSLNRTFMGLDKPTDVLAFPSGEAGDETDPYIGDLIICLPQAQKQAEAGGHLLEREVQLLAVHGTLHMLGFDHDTPENKARLWDRQAEVLKSLGNTLSPP